jgi:hypothetical protein
MRVTRGILRVVLLVALVLSTTYVALALAGEDQAAKPRPAQGSETQFRWVTEQQNPGLWAKIKAAFHSELLPDPGTTSGVAYGYKYVLRIGAFRDSRLVLIGQRSKRHDPPEFDFFVAFTYDIGTSRKTKVAPSNRFWYWRFLTLARIDESPVPDVVFTHDDCIECEAKHRLSSFAYSSADKEWKLRTWPLDGTDLLIGGASKDDPQEIYEYTCLYTLHDFNGDELADIAIWCRERATIRGGEKDTVSLYTMQGGTPRRIAPANTLLASIKKELCMRTPGSSLCASTK